MERVPQLVRRGKKDRRMGAPSELDWEAIEALRTEIAGGIDPGIDTAWAGGGGADAGRRGRAVGGSEATPAREKEK